jgi:hypothetical protein
VPYALLTYPSKDFVQDLSQQKESAFSKISRCENRCFEKMPGFVDFKALSRDSMNSLLEEPQMFSAAVCKLQTAE